MKWSMTIRAFDRITTVRVEAESFKEAVEKIMSEVNLTIEGAEVRDPTAPNYEPPPTVKWNDDHR